MYGPRITVALALNKAWTLSGGYLCTELTMLPDQWIVTVSQFTVHPQGRIFAPGNLRATFDNPKYAALVRYWIDSKYTLRYSGGLVPDIYHILIKGEKDDSR